VALGNVSNSLWAAPMLAASPLHVVLFHEIYGFRNADAEKLLLDAVQRIARAEATVVEGDLRMIPTPHGPHTTSASLLRALSGRARAAGEPISIHLAESEGECRLLAEGDGPMRDLLEERGGWETDWEAPGLTPVAYLHRLGLLSSRTLAVHCVHLTREDHSLLQSSGATVVTCPRSNQRLGVGVAPVPELLREGIPVALGTDSLASSPELDLFGEIAGLRETHPGLSPAAVLRVATLNGARGLGLADRLGSIEPGKLAVLVAVTPDDPKDDALECITTHPAKVRVLREPPAAKSIEP
jgi:cytosine/adenosine deaminase-related metal-dependent hydrolase